MAVSDDRAIVGRASPGVGGSVGSLFSGFTVATEIASSSSSTRVFVWSLMVSIGGIVVFSTL